MNEFDTSKYTIARKDDGSLVRVDGLGGETPEMTQEYYTSQIAFHNQVVVNLQAQKEKLEEYERENPAPDTEE